MRTVLRPLLAALCVCMALSLHAQPSINPISWDYPYQEVRKILYKIEYLDILREIENEQIDARHGNMFATYCFNAGMLYSIELTKTYDKPKKARQTYDECMDYFLSTGAQPIYFTEDSTEKHVIATRFGKVYRLTMHQTSKTEIEVSLFSKAVNHAPACDLVWPDETELNEAEDGNDE